MEESLRDGQYPGETDAEALKRRPAVESTGDGREGQCPEEDFAALLDRKMGLPQKDWSQYSPLALAWLGDSVCDLAVRTTLLKRANMQTDKLHRKASGIVNARAQAKLMAKIRPGLTDEETAVYRRGRNASPAHTAKNTDRAAYLEATGFECLIGYLYLMKRYDRILELIEGMV